MKDYSIHVRVYVNDDDQVVFDLRTVGRRLNAQEKIRTDTLMKRLRKQSHDFAEGFRHACRVLEQEPPAAAFLAHAMATHLRGYPDITLHWEIKDPDFDTEISDVEIPYRLSYGFHIGLVEKS